MRPAQRSDAQPAQSVSSGLKTFALVSVILLTLSVMRVEPSGVEAGGLRSVGGSRLSAEELAAQSPEELAALVEQGLLDEATVSALVEQGLLAPGTAGSGGAAGSAGGKVGGGVNVGGGSGPRGPGSGTGPGGSNPPGIECAAGRNGGVTAPGVTGTEIRVATTAALDGPAKSLLAPSVTSIKAVFDKVNQAGGICGRRIVLRVDNDGFDSASGQRIIRNYIDDGDVFALPVVPSAEGLGAAINSGEIKAAGIPVVGTDGLRREQYGDPWVWPVATSTTSTMRVIAKRATGNAAKTFAIVYDDRYQFGIEGKNAFEDQVQALGGSMVTSVALNPGDPAYGGQSASFNTACGSGKCDAVVLLLLPDTAAKWLKAKPELGRLYTAGAQTLFTDDFARACVRELSSKCAGFEVWTGYNPPIGALASKPGVAEFVRDVRAKDPGIDVNNQFVQGSYLGASVFVQALRDAGPNLTRARLQAVLDAMTYKSDLSSDLTWSSGRHRANASSQSFAMAVSQGTFQGWSTGSGSFIADPNPSGG